METRQRGVLLVAVWAVLMAGLSTPDAGGQGLGTFRWQFFPFCNVVTLSAVQEGSVFTLAGFDDQCGGASRAAATGTAFNNASGFGMGLTIVPPNGVPVSAAIVLNAVTLSGTWVDDTGGTGEFRFNPATVTGSPRPAGSTLIIGSDLAPGAVDTGAIADGAVGATDLNAAEVQRRVTGSCASGQFLQAVNQDGTVTCAPDTVGGVTGTLYADPTLCHRAADQIDPHSSLLARHPPGNAFGPALQVLSTTLPPFRLYCHAPVQVPPGSTLTITGATLSFVDLSEFCLVGAEIRTKVFGSSSFGDIHSTVFSGANESDVVFTAVGPQAKPFPGFNKTLASNEILFVTPLQQNTGFNIVSETNCRYGGVLFTYTLSRP